MHHHRIFAPWGLTLVCAITGCGRHGGPTASSPPVTAVRRASEGRSAGAAPSRRPLPRAAPRGQAVGAHPSAAATSRPPAPPPRPRGVSPDPRADTDGDGIPDAQDRCPTEPEDRDAHQDGDGCPDPDNDGDGVADVDDQCPGEPEDKDGDRDADGCPER